jgi:hypothetical protein
VAKHALNNLQLLALLDQLGRARVAELVERVVRFAALVGEANAGTRLGPLVVHGVVAETGAAVRAEEGGMAWLAFTLAKLCAQGAEALRRGHWAKDNYALCAVLRIAHVERLAAGIKHDIAKRKGQHLASSGPGSVG